MTVTATALGPVGGFTALISGGACPPVATAIIVRTRMLPTSSSHRALALVSQIIDETLENAFAAAPLTPSTQPPCVTWPIMFDS